MADIKVTLELDDRGYSNKLKAAESQAKTFAQTASAGMKSAQDAVGGLATKIESLNSKLGGLSSAIVGAGIVAFTHSLLESANQLKDMANGVDISIGRMMELGAVAAKSGSSLEGMAAMLNKLEASAYNAADGDAKLRVAFENLGLSMRDLTQMTPDQAFIKIAGAMAGIEDPATRAGLSMQIFGKTARGFDWAGFAGDVGGVVGTMGKYEEAQKRANEISEQMAQKLILVKAEFLNLLDPLLKLLQPTGDFSDQMDRARITAQVLAGVLAAFAVGQVINAFAGLVTVIRGIAAGFTAVAGTSTVATAAMALNSSAALANAAAISFMTGAMGRVGTATAAVAVAEETLNLARSQGTATAAAISVLENNLAAARTRLSIATSAASTTQAALNTLQIAGAGASTAAAAGTATLAGRLAGLAGVAVTAGLAIAALWPSDLNSGEQETLAAMSELTKLTKEQYDAYLKLNPEEQKKVRTMLAQRAEAEKLGKVIDKPLPEFKMPEMPTGGNNLLDPKNVKDMQAATQEQARSIQAQTDQMVLLNKRTIERIDLEGQLALNSKADREARLAAYDAETKKIQDIFRIDQDISKLEQERLKDPDLFRIKGQEQLIETYKKQKEALQGIADATEDVKRKQIESQNAAEMMTYFIEQQNKARQNVMDLEDELQTLTLSGYQKQLGAVDRLIKKEIQLAIEKRRAQLGPEGNVSEEERAQIAERITAIYEKQKTANENLTEASRTFSTGWQKAYNEYADAASNAASQAENIFKKATQGMEDAIVNFAKTGKFEWKNFLSMMLEELLRSQIRQAFANLLGTSGGGAGGAGAAGGGMLGALGGFLGGGGSSGGGGGGAAATAAAGGGLLSGLKNLFTGGGNDNNIPTFNTDQLYQPQYDSMDSLLNDIGYGSNSYDFGTGSDWGNQDFGGYFASGGFTGGNRPIMVGERGPEMFLPSGSGNIIPNNQLGGGTSVVYNINAVDAASFKQMLARDPSFLYAVTEQGRKTIPGAR